MRATVTLIHQAKHFRIITIDPPHISRTDGGHLIVEPNEPIEDRTKLTSEQAIELMQLTIIAGKAMKAGLAKHGIEIGRINYQDNGNWNHSLHIHLYGRAKGATVQKYGWSLRFPLTAEDAKTAFAGNEPLREEEVASIREEIVRLVGYRNSAPCF